MLRPVRLLPTALKVGLLSLALCPMVPCGSPSGCAPRRDIGVAFGSLSMTPVDPQSAD